MKIIIRILLFVCIVYLGILTVKSEFGGYEVGFMSDFRYFGHFLLLIFTMLTLLVEVNSYRQNKKLYSFSITTLSLLFWSVVIYKTAQRNIIESKKIVLNISNLPKANNVLRFEFKAGDVFKLIEYNRMGQVIYFGNYIKVNDTIKIISSNYNGFADTLPEWGVLKKDTMIWNRFDTMVVNKN